MASLQDIPGTIEYLSDAAHLLRILAPETSAHIMSHRNQLLSEHNIHLSDLQKQQVCRACGNIIIPNQDAAVTIESRKARRKWPQKRSAKRPAPTPKSRTIVIACGRCNKSTRVSIPEPHPLSRSQHNGKGLRSGNTSNNKVIAAEPPSSASSVTANASSKRRAKNRKAGLQALLSVQKNSQSKPLSLADFMQK